MQLLKPDYIVSGFSIVNRKWLSNHHIQYIFSDLDNTLVPHGETGTEALDAWIAQLEEAGITLIGTSNNNTQRAKEFRFRHKIEVIEDCKKPWVKILKDYMEEHEIDKEKVLFMGDQVLIDILCGNLLKLDTVLVEPIKKNAPMSVRLTWLIDKYFFRS